MEGVLKALDAAATNIRSKLGESLSSVQKYATPLMEATTPSLEALKACTPGTEHSVRERGKRRAAFLQTGGRTRSEFCHGLSRELSVVLRQPQRRRSGSRKCAQSLRAAGESEREGTVLHRVDLLRHHDRGAGEGGAGVANYGSRPIRGTICHTTTWDSFQPALETGKKHWRKAARRYAWNRTTRSTTTTLAPRTSTSTGWMKRRRCTSRQRNASWRTRT